LGFFGLSKGGIKVSKAIMAGSLIAPLFIDGTGAQGSSPIDVMLGHNVYQPYTGTQKVKNALGYYIWNTLGFKVDGFVGDSGMNPKSRGLGALGFGCGLGIGLAGKFVNPAVLGGSPVKL